MMVVSFIGSPKFLRRDIVRTVIRKKIDALQNIIIFSDCESRAFIFRLWKSQGFETEIKLRAPGRGRRVLIFPHPDPFKHRSRCTHVSTTPLPLLSPLFPSLLLLLLLLFNKVENFPKRLIEANVEEKECGLVIDKWLMNKSVIRGLLKRTCLPPFSSLKYTLTD